MVGWVPNKGLVACFQGALVGRQPSRPEDGTVGMNSNFVNIESNRSVITTNINEETRTTRNPSYGIVQLD